MINYLRKAEKGFTLVELLVCICIIGILSAISIPQYTKYKEKAYNVAALSDAKNCYTSIQAYLIDNPGVDASEVTLANAEEAGFISTTSVTTTITTAVGTVVSKHDNGHLIYSVDIDGVITSASA